MYRILRVPLLPQPELSEALWRLREIQDQAYNLGVELGLAGETAPALFAAHAELTRRRQDGSLPGHPLALQRAGLRRGLGAVRAHRRARRRLEESVGFWERQDDPLRHGRARDRLSRHQARGETRLFRRRRLRERGRGGALVLDGQVRLVSERELRLPGGVLLMTREPVVVPEGWRFTGAVQLRDTTRRVSRRTRPRHRRYALLLSLSAPDPEKEEPRERSDVLGIDMGVEVAVSRSDGEEHHLPREQDLVGRLRSEQQRQSRRVRGSRRFRRHSRTKRALGRRLRGRRRNASRQLAAQVAATPHRAVAAEALRPEQMSRSARGSRSHPGQRVGPKRALNRKLRAAVIGQILSDIERACLLRGIRFIQVPAAGTSRLCHSCGAEGRRETQASFLCPSCGWSGNADYNAACNVRDRAWNAAAGTVVERRSAGGNPVRDQGRQKEMPGRPLVGHSRI